MNKIFDIPQYKGAGIYVIINKEKNKAYVGCAICIKSRASTHESQLRRKCHGNKYLNGDSGDKLDFVILHKANKKVLYEELLILEKLYMLYMKKQGFSLYNILPKENMSCEEISNLVIRKIDSFANIQKNIRKSIKHKK